MDFTKGIKDGIPIALGYFSVSIAFGLMAVEAGCTWVEAMLISLTNLTSAGQFAGVTVLAHMGTYIEMALTQLVINSRYALMGISLSQKVNARFKGLWRVILGFAITDEIFAVAIGQEGEISRRYFAGLAIIPIIGWTSGTIVGAVLGNIMPEIITSALGVALYGMFIAVVVPKARENIHVLAVVIIAVAISVALRYIPVFSGISAGFAIIICAVIASAAGAVFFPVKEDKQ
ncbi:MAG: AzlC family ABC transporter permease [Clostridiales bacterium]|nr:AzlC family ABC transporter permease [Clostridiales bacterium]